MSHLEIHNHVLETLDLSPDLWLEDVVAVLGCHHHIAIQTKLSAPCSIEITKKIYISLKNIQKNTNQ